MKNNGFVSLVGAGPGDAELLTLKALRLIKEADIVVYDRLVSTEILDMIPTGVSMIYVGKMPGKHCVPQHEINEIIIHLAKSGRRVVRLKGGDPYMFGRGGEEALQLQHHNIGFEIVPGISAASGCSAYSGIPLTFRGMSRRVQFITGHFNEDEPLNLNWQSIADQDSTLVIYMGLSNLPEIVRSLIQAGLEASTPAAAIQDGTSKQQQMVISPLDQLVDSIQAKGLQSPVMIIIGEVVSLSEQLDWFQGALDAEQIYEKVAAHY